MLLRFCSSEIVSEKLVETETSEYFLTDLAGLANSSSSVGGDSICTLAFFVGFGMELTFESVEEFLSVGTDLCTVSSANKFFYKFPVSAVFS